MIFCNECGSPITEQVNFCGECGARVIYDRESLEDTVFGSENAYVDTRDYTPRPAVSVLSFAFFFVGLIIYTINKDKRPGLAASAFKGVISFLSVMVPIAGLFIFIGNVKCRRDLARVAGISAIVGTAVAVFAYMLYWAWLFTIMMTI